jgi:hypothetical protein
MNQEVIMLRSPAFLGFSMVRRSSRRRLVAVVYAILLGLMAAAIIIFPLAGHQGRGLALASCMLVVYPVVSWSIFGKLARETVLPGMHGGEMTSLGLMLRRRAEDELDEREVAVRNAAYFAAYRAVAVYSYILLIALIYSSGLRASVAFPLLQLLVVPLLAMVLTLPPAVILWREPDVAEEAGV